MDEKQLWLQAEALERQIALLPAGSITKKNVNGREYFYHRWTEEKKRREKYIPADELSDFQRKIEKRKALERELKEIRKQLPQKKTSAETMFKTHILKGSALRRFADSVRDYRKRECFLTLRDYIYGEPQDKVLILYGLRRTGKTTMIRQIFAEMSDEELSQTVAKKISEVVKNVDEEM